MRICVDIDGTICTFRGKGETYADVVPKKGAVEALRALRADGHTIVIYTARNMGSTGHNVGKVMANIGKITLDWLARYGVPYDEIFFGKPNADITIDDRVIRFEDNWHDMTSKNLEKVAKPQ
jgi:capsule biosynthesis phosphatase